MSLTVTSILSALVLTYLVSRIAWRSLAAMESPVRLVAAHLVSLVLLAAAVALIKNYFSSFAWQQATVLVLPQLCWFGYDVLRGRADRARG